MKNNIIFETFSALYHMFSGCLPWIIFLAIIWALAMILYPA